MRVPDSPTVPTEWNPACIYYLERALFILQICASILSIFLFLLWQFFIIVFLPIWLVGLFPWFIYFLISWRSMSKRIMKKWSDFEKILISTGVLLNAAIIFLIMLRSEYNSENILKIIVSIIFFCAPSLTILLILIRANLYRHFSNEPALPEIAMKRDYTQPPDWGKL
jgi:NADH:ubiquinone oxidoreductase subunit K